MILLKRRVGVLISFLIFCVSATSQTKLYILRYPSKTAINSVNAAPQISHLQNADLPKKYLVNAAPPNKYLQNGDPFKKYLQNAALPNRYIQNADPSKKYLTNAAPPNSYLQNADRSNQYLLNAALPNRDLGNGVSNRQGLSDRQILLLLLNIVIKQQNQKVEETKSECLRLFGSMHGTKDEKIRCLESLKKSKLERDKLEATLPNRNSRTKGPLLNKPFVDYTRIAEDYFGFDKFKRTDFSTDYIDFDDLRSEKPNDDDLKSDKDESGTKYNPEFKDFRKFSQRRKKDRKNNENDRRQRSLYSSDDDSENSMEVSKKNHVRIFKPKRFQVIRNVNKPSSSNENEKGSKTKHYESLFESKPRKTKRKVKKVKFQTSSEESIKSSKNKNVETESSSDEIDSQAKNSYNKDSSQSESSNEVVTKKPSKSKTKHKKVAKSSSEKYPKPSQKKHKKETYLQGHRVVDLRRHGRNRLEQFMPKRFHWDDEEFKHLGYYWFNGPQGNFPFHRIRP